MPLPAGWEERRSSTTGAVYYYNTVTAETSRRRPEALTSFDLKQQKQRCLEEVVEYAKAKLRLGDDSAEIGEYLVSVFEDADGLQPFLATFEGDGIGVAPEDLATLFHLIHMLHPDKKRCFAESRRYRERRFDPRPPEGWEVRESTSRVGQFYYLKTATGETSRGRPAEGGRPDEPVSRKRSSATQAPRSERLVVTEVEVRADIVPAFLRGNLTLSAGDTNLAVTRLVRNPQGTLSKAAALPSALLEMRRKEGMQAGKQWEMPAAGTQAGRRGARLPIFAAQLPVRAHRAAIVEAVQKARCLIIIGETGSGKTTQIPQYVADSLVGPGVVACTQPRRVSAISIAKRVAEERRTRVGGEVGYAVRFDDCCSTETRIKYMTDGMLLRELLSNTMLEGYAAVMIDEAHERTITSDMLLLLLKRLLQQNTAIKVLISSATIDAKKFSSYFLGSDVFYIPGRTHTVETLYLNEREEDWYAMALKVVFEIHANEGAGDILVFLTGQDEIDVACQICYEWYVNLSSDAANGPMPKMQILPLYSSLPAENQADIFEPTPKGVRKVIFATNIAETSITIDGITFVVDCGFAKTKTYDPVSKMDCLVVAPISQAAARQRAGRAGRTAPGKCFRMYTEESYDNEMLPQSVPEMQRSNLETTVLMLKQHAEADIYAVDFLDTPPRNLINAALFTLFHLGALDAAGNMTPVGHDLLRFPLEPHLSRLVLSACRLGCAAEACGVIALLTCGSQVFNRPRANQAAADAAKQRHALPQGDHPTLLNIFMKCGALRGAELAGWCRDNFVSMRAIESSLRIAAQLVKLAAPGHTVVHSNIHDSVPLLQRAVCEASVLRAARRYTTENGVVVYRTLTEEMHVAVHPTSVYARMQWDDSPEWLVYHELVQTRREYLRTVTAVDPQWLQEAAPLLYDAVSTTYQGEEAAAMRHEMAALRSGMRSGAARNSDAESDDDRLTKRRCRDERRRRR